ncbi:glycosyltransferase [Pseudodesulfovibrio cashew]|uniref:Glycosyltransferase n=1 Tax=Pseudodesulfovibrio cashew TaxID=2678688 RepID=A0A6I6JFE0_9BACT|nr:glycosyltransferase [Pseudodesulfovibrio cashew]QGY39728.1 glycosyltransferase [Pseudodesulfovibrio cashew]
MKILHVITGLDVGGAETMLYRLCSGMNPNRFESRVVSLIPPGPVGEQLSGAGIEVDSLDMRRGVPSPAGLFKLVRLIRSWRPDLIQTWLYHADLAGLMAAKLAFPLGGGPKVAWNIRCSYMALEEYRRLTGLTLRACAALSGLPDLILTNSHDAKRFHQELGYHPKRFEVVHNGFDIDRFKPDPAAREEVRRELSVDSDSLIIGQVARFDPMKDHQTMIRAAAAVQSDRETVFVFAGRGMDHDNLDLATWLAESGLDPARVRLLGERADVPRLMAAMDIHVSSSLGESFPGAVGEAMACGVPNVVTDVGDAALLAGETGVTVPPGDPAALATALSRLAALEPGALRTMGQAARLRIAERFSLSAMVECYERIYAA